MLNLVEHNSCSHWTKLPGLAEFRKFAFIVAFMKRQMKRKIHRPKLDT